jgi:hypothetical protein
MKPGPPGAEILTRPPDRALFGRAVPTGVAKGRFLLGKREKLL